MCVYVSVAKDENWLSVFKSVLIQLNLFSFGSILVFRYVRRFDVGVILYDEPRIDFILFLYGTLSLSVSRRASRIGQMRCSNSEWYIVIRTMRTLSTVGKFISTMIFKHLVHFIDSFIFLWFCIFVVVASTSLKSHRCLFITLCLSIG